MSDLEKLGRRGVLGGVGAALVAGAATSSGIMSNLLIRSREVVTVTERGATLAGLRAALREVGLKGGGVVQLGVSAILIDSGELARVGSIYLSSATTIEGENASLIIDGSSIGPPLFVAKDVSNVGLRNLIGVGNGRGIADTRSGAFAEFELSSHASGDIEDLRLENIHLSRFRSERWIQFLQRNRGRRMSGLRISDLHANQGSSVDPGAIAVSSAALWIHGFDGQIDDVEVSRPVVDASGLKSGVVLFHKVRNATITEAAIEDAGLTGATDNAGGYAMMAYADRGEMSDISFVEPVIRNPRSAGIYIRGAEKVRVISPLISGQTDEVITSLPKGAIALNGSSGVMIQGGRLENNACDLAVADGGLSSLDLDVRQVKTSGSRTSVLLEVSPGSAPVSGAKFSGCDLSATVRVFRVLNEQVPGRYYNDVWIQGGNYRSTTAAIVIEFTQGQVTGATGYRIEGVVIQANGIAIMATGLQGSLRIQRTTIEGLGNLRYGISADDCPGIDWDAVTFRNIPSGLGYSARYVRRPARGTIRRLHFDKVGTPMARGSVQEIL